MRIEFTPRPDQPPLAQLVDQLLAIGASLSEIVDHMALTAAGGGSAPDAAAIPVVLRGLLEGVLAPLTERRGDDAIATAAALVGEVERLIGSEIHLVPVEGRV